MWRKVRQDEPQTLTSVNLSMSIHQQNNQRFGFGARQREAAGTFAYAPAVVEVCLQSSPDEILSIGPVWSVMFDVCQ